MNSRSSAGVSQISCTISPRSAELCAADPFSRTCREADAVVRPVPISCSVSPRATVAATAHSVSSPILLPIGDGPLRVCSASLAPRRPRPGDSSEIASSTLVLPAPFGPASTTGAPLTAISPLA